MAYEHRQHQPFIAILLGLILVATFAGMVFMPSGTAGFDTLPVVIGIVAIAALGLFSRLTTRVADGAVSWCFGWGFPGGAFPVADIARVERTETSFWEGWGIHWTIWHGWLWNTWGFQAVQIFRKDGSSMTIGTDDPEGLINAINGTLRQAQGDSV